MKFYKSLRNSLNYMSKKRMLEFRINLFVYSLILLILSIFPCPIFRIFFFRFLRSEKRT